MHAVHAEVGQRFPDEGKHPAAFHACDKAWLDSERLSVSAANDRLLAHDPRTRLLVCRNCGKPLGWDDDYGICRFCRDERQRFVRLPTAHEDDDYSDVWVSMPNKKAI